PGAHSNFGLAIAATDFGIVGIDDANNIKPISARPNVTSIAVAGNTVLAGLFNGGVADLTPELTQPANRTALTDKPSLAIAGSVEASRLPHASATVEVSDGVVWALTEEGAYVRAVSSSKPAFEPAAASLTGGRMLTAGHITGLAIDDRGMLWVGYFDRGIDVIDPESAERLAHLEDEQLRQVNCVTFDAAGSRVLAATSRGLAELGSRTGPATAKMTVLTREKDNIISNSIAHVAFGETARGARSMVLATAGGLTEVAEGRSRSLTAFHGLASNHLYAAAFGGSKLFVGSLAGLVELENLRVVRTYKTSNSRLSHDWVTALAFIDGSLYVGTNGGGVDALLQTGEWINFADFTGKFEVNQNAMCYDNERLYVGTTTEGILVYNLRDRTWIRFTAGLSSRNVTALTTDNQFVYAGTLNGLTRIEKRAIK
ncbi:MAG TPA: hypothetical protein VFV34_25545, partial [Blastocatellia bacterium]|nr:hypothetical protein [Blastocatellia bacterium]